MNAVSMYMPDESLFVDRIFYHYYVNPKSTVLSKNAEYHKDIMTSNMLLYKQLKERGAWDCFHDELELDLLFTWYLGTMKVICLCMKTFHMICIFS